MTDLFFSPDTLPEAVPAETAPVAEVAYRVLARKYRPQTFAQLVGQEVLVRTLTNAFKVGRIAHAFMLTGVRGVGKTTTARIIARGLNCTGPDGAGGPTIEPCGVCQNCVAIAADRHVDVIEMDAASHNSVDDIRELTDGARYSPALGRHKVYIIDEVHMLSKAAFNALLKTLEEPPPHVKFILATTEIRKVPVTILSRCQRFDLRRVDAAALTGLFTRILEQERSAADPDALALLARAADGSARDGLSLLDQAISRAEDGRVSGEQVRAMLGLADRIVVFDLLEAVLKGEAKAALGILAALHEAGADPVTTLHDLLELVHHLTRTKLVPANVDDPTVPEAERERGSSLARLLSMPVLTRAWNVLLKGLGEIQVAPSPRQALEMIVLRLVYTADLPPPGELVRQLRDAPPPAGTPGSGNAGPSAGRPSAYGGTSATARAIALQPDYDQSAEPSARHPTPATFQGVIDLFMAEREAVIAGHLVSAVHLVRFEPGTLEFRPEPSAPPSLAQAVMKNLSEWTGRRWMVSISRESGAATLAAQQQASRTRAMVAAGELPGVKALLEAFPGARLTQVRDLSTIVIEADTTGDNEPLSNEEGWLEE